MIVGDQDAETAAVTPLASTTFEMVPGDSALVAVKVPTPAVFRTDPGAYENTVAGIGGLPRVEAVNADIWTCETHPKFNVERASVTVTGPKVCVNVEGKVTLLPRSNVSGAEIESEPGGVLDVTVSVNAVDPEPYADTVVNICDVVIIIRVNIFCLRGSFM